MIRLVTLFLGLVFSPFISAQSTNTAIYKWVENGSIKYSYYVPADVKNYELVTKNKTNISKEDKEEDEDFPTVKDLDSKEDRERGTIKQENCRISKENIKALEGGAVFDKKADGAIYELSEEEKKIRLDEAKKGIDFYCS